jgi:HPt (histidine-containing phosphotransfer) domain-containing protein
LVSEFKTSLINELKQFNIENEKQELEALRALAHKLSGAAHLSGFSELSQKATELETNIKNGNTVFTDVAPKIDALIAEIKGIIGKLTRRNHDCE